MNTFILIFQCKDQKGIVAKASGLIFKCNGNIVALDQYSTHLKDGHLFMRIEFMVDGEGSIKDKLDNQIRLIARYFKADFKLYNKEKMLRMGVFVSKPGHCLADILYLQKRGELAVEIPFVISNFPGHRGIVEQYKIPFYFIPAGKKNRKEDEILRYALKSTDFLVLARYMLVLSPSFIKSYAKDIINIHHGLLPSFKGANPYQQALNAGVKEIGATAHFVTEKLDVGPIIAQAVEAVSHKDDLKSLLLKGMSLEKRALNDALHAYIEHRVIRFKDKTVIF
ncbi:MAG: formyltetrahydrofolate deformylase [Candidatus Omnitrophota bacterium]|jgi:formyltetrahydrofolate deformylase